MIKILLHLMACYVIADVVYEALPRKIGGDEYWQPIIPRLIAVFVAGVVGVGKEFFDMWQGEMFSAGDITIDCVGALAWLFVLLIGEELYKRGNT